MYNETKKTYMYPKTNETSPTTKQKCNTCMSKKLETNNYCIQKKKERKKKFVDLKNSFTLCRNGIDHHDQEHSH